MKLKQKKDEPAGKESKREWVRVSWMERNRPWTSRKHSNQIWKNKTQTNLLEVILKTKANCFVQECLKQQEKLKNPNFDVFLDGTR